MTQPSRNWRGYFQRMGSLEEHQLPSMVHPFAQDVARVLDQGRVVAGNEEFQVRGSAHQIPMRVRLDYSSMILRTEVEAQLNLGNGRYFTVLSNHTYTPQATDDDVWSDDDHVRLFLAKHTIIEGERDDVAEEHESFQLLPSDLRTFLVQYAQACQATVGVYPESGTINIFDLGRVPDPFVTIQQAVWILGYAGSVFPRVPARAEAEIEMGPPVLNDVVCAYCAARYIPTLHTHCPNCGAPRR